MPEKKNKNQLRNMHTIVIEKENPREYKRYLGVIKNLDHLVARLKKSKLKPKSAAAKLLKATHVQETRPIYRRLIKTDAKTVRKK